MSDEKPPMGWRGKLLGSVAIIALGSLLVWGFFAGRVSAKNGATVITIDDDTQEKSGIKTQTLEAAPHQEQIRAYGMILDIARLTELSNRYNCRHALGHHSGGHRARDRSTAAVPVAH